MAPQLTATKGPLALELLKVQRSGHQFLSRAAFPRMSTEAL